MLKKVLIVDDDRILRHLVKKKFKAHEAVFATLLAEDGEEAVQILKDHAVSLVVTDLHMPKMDGFELLAHMSAKYPDIAVIVLTAYGSPKSKEKVLATGAAGFVEKPFVVEDLAATIIATLEKESEGGTLHTVSIDMFLQLIEMEQKTCTIRVINKETEKRGVLFIKNGNLMDARIRDVNGKEAAYEIFSWDNPSLSIQDTCVLNKKVIQEDLQAVLFDAMRLKDEAGEDESAFRESPAEEPPPAEMTATEKQAPPKKPPRPTAVEPVVQDPQQKGIDGTGPDAAWDPLMTLADTFGKAINAGNFKACYVDQGKGNRLVLLPGDVTTVVKLKKNCPGDVILRLLYE